MLWAMVCGVQAKEKYFTLKSPNGKLVTHIVSTAENELTYDIVYDGITILLPSHLGLNRQMGKTATADMVVEKSASNVCEEDIASPFTSQDRIHSKCNELTLKIKDGLYVDFRAYNSGIAYRYRATRDMVVLFEKVEYNFADDYQATVPYVSRYKEDDHNYQYESSFENLYTNGRLSELDTKRLCFLPLMVHASHGIKVGITESNLEHFPGLYLKGMGHPGRLEGEHAPLPRECRQGGHNNLQLRVVERESYIARIAKGDEMPWRIAMVAENDAEMAMNKLSYILGPKCRLDDYSWVKPGKVAWDWWNDWNIEGVPFKSGINNDTYKFYIDFAEKFGIEYVILDEGWAVNKQADLMQVVPEIDLEMLVDYANDHHVGLILWAGYYAFERDMENVCRHYAEMGIKGFKIDFMDRDDQLMTDFYYRAAAMCAKYHLLADFHGAFKPAGLNRAYPNVINFEGVAGLEQLKWAPASWNQVQYDTEIPFIRQTAGPMDYTQGAMINAAKGCYHPRWSEPMSQGTRCHQLGLYVVLESPLNMLCDAPTNYMKEPEYTRFIAEMPTTWDETRVLEGVVGEYIVTARRKGSVWYIGGITNWTAREVEIDLSSLVSGSHPVEIYRDGANAHRKGSDYIRETARLQGASLMVRMAPGGGFVIKIS